MRCEDIHPHVADYLAGTLSPAETADIETHLRECRLCAAKFTDLRETWQLLADVPAERPDSARLRARLHATIAGYEQGILAQPSSFSRVTQAIVAWWRVPSMAQAAIALALLVTGVVIGRESPLAPVSPDPGIAALRQELGDMRQMMTLSLMQQQSASDRLKGVTWTGQIEQPGNEVVAALLDTLMHDTNANVRLASIDALKRFAERDLVRRGTIDAFPRQNSPLVQIALIDFVIERYGRESASTLRRLAQDPMLEESVRARAAWGLQQVG